MRAYELYEDTGRARALGIMSVMQNSNELKLMARADEGNISRGHWQMLFEQSLRVLRL